MGYINNSRMKTGKSFAAKKGTATSKSNYSRSYQFRKGNCHNCGKRGHYVQDCAAKREKKSSVFDPEQHQANYTNQHSVSDRNWTNGSEGYDFMKAFESCLENARKSLALSNSDSLEVYSSSTSSSSASDSSQDYSFQSYFSSQDYSSPASECYSSSDSDSCLFYSSSKPDSSEGYSSSASESHDSHLFSLSKLLDSFSLPASDFVNSYCPSPSSTSSITMQDPPTKLSKVRVNTFLTTKPEVWEHYSRQNGSATASHGHITSIKDILSLDCTQPQTSQFFPMSQSEPSPFSSTIQSVETSTSHGDLGSSKMIQSSTVKLVPQPIGELKGIVPENLGKSNRIVPRPLSELKGLVPENLGKSNRIVPQPLSELKGLVPQPLNEMKGFVPQPFRVVKGLVPQPLSELKGCEESQLYQSPTLSISEKASDERQVSIGTGACSLSENIRQVSKEGLDSAEECHKLVHSMHNLSVLLLTNSSSSDHLSESDLQGLQSVICNLSECLVKRMNVSTWTHGSAVNPEKQDVTANTKKTEKGCNTSEEKEDPARISAKAIQSQMLNIEGELNLMKSEIRCLRMELEMKRLKKNHKGAHRNGNIETLANNSDTINGSCPEVSLGIQGNDFDYTAAPISQGGSNGLPDLKLNSIMDSQSKTDANFIEKHEGIILSQDNMFGESIPNSSLETSGHNSGQPNSETQIEQIEGQFRVVQDQRSKHSDLEDQGIEFFENHAEIEKLNPGDNMDFVHMRAYMGNDCDNFLQDGAMVESPTDYKSSLSGHNTGQLNTETEMEQIECQIRVLQEPRSCSEFDIIDQQFEHLHSPQRSDAFAAINSDMDEEKDSDLDDQGIDFFENDKEIEKLNPEDNNDFIDIRACMENTFLEDGAIVESPTETKSSIFSLDMDNVDAIHTVECLESDSSWEQIDFDKEDHI
ncbi:hypothetical protein KI387_019327 [Taxus chinensis]|uniref:CCHC-type domain-containing protein n=1 Tax=Taxus chinensis TaxID=29808 RepID=A0AA38G9Z1_TAXCH|nr:hypothetical protein KI387_019327 [Taxus chinensis]